MLSIHPPRVSVTQIRNTQVASFFHSEAHSSQKIRRICSQFRCLEVAVGVISSWSRRVVRLLRNEPVTFLNRQLETPARDLPLLVPKASAYSHGSGPIQWWTIGGSALNLLLPSASKMTVEHTHGELKSTMFLCTCLTTRSGPITDDRLVVFFDIDDTLYSPSLKIGQAMIERLHGKCATRPRAESK